MSAADVVAALDALSGAGVDVVLGGGWGIDALLEEQTRPHRDLDVAVPADRLEAAVAALTPLGYTVVADQRPARLVLSDRAHEIDLHPVHWDRDGNGVQTGLDGQTFRYPGGWVRSHGSIAGRRVRCCSPELQALFHAGYAPRDHDREDMRRLNERFGVPLPEAYR